MSTHMDQMNAWWESAEEAGQKEGDTVIYREDSATYTVLIAGYDEDDGDPNARILHRAPKPKPAWHDAVAVMARCSNAPEGHREPFIRSEAAYDVWAGEAGHARTEDLRDVTPLIEAKVTDEMCDRVRDYYRTEHHAELPRDAVWLNDLLMVALGVDPA